MVTKEEKEAADRAFREKVVARVVAGESYTEIAKDLKQYTSTIRRIAQAAGVKSKHRPGSGNKRWRGAR